MGSRKSSGVRDAGDGFAAQGAGEKARSGASACRGGFAERTITRAKSRGEVKSLDMSRVGGKEGDAWEAATQLAARRLPAAAQAPNTIAH